MDEITDHERLQDRLLELDGVDSSFVVVGPDEQEPNRDRDATILSFDLRDGRADMGVFALIRRLGWYPVSNSLVHSEPKKIGLVVADCPAEELADPRKPGDVAQRPG
jgi:hypothetical protein